MSTRLARAAAVILVILAVSATPIETATAHPGNTPFPACASRSQSGGQCLRRNLVWPGNTIYLRGRLVGHAGQIVRLLRLTPSGNYRRVASPRVQSGGHIQWGWQTRGSDVDNVDPYFFWFCLPRHGDIDSCSQVVSVGVTNVPN